jgi:hypothetical protein
VQQLRIPAVAKIASSPEPKLPEFKLPALKRPKLDLDAVLTAQKANLAVVHEAQRVLVDAGQAIAKVQQGYLERAVAEAKAAAEKTVVTGKEVVGLAAAAQRRVAELVAQRTAANVAQLKTLAAA